MIRNILKAMNLQYLKAKMVHLRKTLRNLKLLVTVQNYLAILKSHVVDCVILKDLRRMTKNFLAVENIPP